MPAWYFRAAAPTFARWRFISVTRYFSAARAEVDVGRVAGAVAGFGVALGFGAGFGVALLAVRATGAGVGFGFGFGSTANLAERWRSIGVPSAERALSATRRTTVALYGKSASGSKTSTVSSSAKVTLPLTAAPLTSTLKARFVERRSIAWVNRTETSVSRA